MAKKIVEPFDGTKLDKELQQRNITRQDASEMLGFNRDYLTDCTRRGTISTDAIERLARVFFIKRENIKRDPVEPEEEPTKIPMQMQAGLTKQDIVQAVEVGVRYALEAYFGKRAEPVAMLADKWKDALHSMEADQ